MRRRRVALIDNTVNISYVTAKLLRRIGYDAELVQQRGAPFNHQPFWEDLDLVEDTSDGTPPVRHGHWEDLEQQVGWHRPEWVVRPDNRDALPNLPQLCLRAGRAVPAYLAPLGAAIGARDMAVIAAASQRDVVFALGPSAAQAMLTGRPYVVLITGWDVRDLPFRTGARNPVHRARAWLQRAALASAWKLLIDPEPHLPHLRRLGAAHRATPCSIPVDAHGYAAIASGRPEDVFGADIAARLRGKALIFAPARIDFAIKRNDALLEALPAILRRVPVHVVMLEWGPDVHVARRLVKQLRIEEAVSFAPVVMSKVRLIRAIKLADIVADQFLLASYGMLAREALACGTPVLSSYEPGKPHPHPADDPAPIRSVRAPNELAAACVELLDRSNRERVARAGIAWVDRQNEAAMRTITQVLDEAPETGRGGGRRLM